MMSPNQSRFTKTKAAGFGSEPPPTGAVPAGRTRRCTTDERCGVSIFPGSCNHCACVCVLFPCRYQCHTIYPADRDEAQQMFPEREGSLVKMKLLQLKCPKGNISFLEAHLVDFPVCSASSPSPHPSTLPRSSLNPGFEKKKTQTLDMAAAITIANHGNPPSPWQESTMATASLVPRQCHTPGAGSTGGPLWS